MGLDLKTKLFYTLFLLMAVGTVHGGEISGTATAGRSAYAGGVISVQNDKGQIYRSRTDERGMYSFKQLPAGYYTVAMEPPPGYEISTPACGFYYAFLEGSLNLPFQAMATGVIVDFGDPVVGGGGFSFFGNSIDVSVFIQGLSIYQPDRIEIKGYWYVPGAGYLDATAVNGWPAGVYAGGSMLVNYLNLGGGGMTLSMQMSPSISVDGEIATFVLSLTQMAVLRLEQRGGQLAFCGEYVRMYSNGQLVYDSNTVWNGNVSDLGGIAGVKSSRTR